MLLNSITNGEIQPRRQLFVRACSPSLSLAARHTRPADLDDRDDRLDEQQHADADRRSGPVLFPPRARSPFGPATMQGYDQEYDQEYQEFDDEADLITQEDWCVRCLARGEASASCELGRC